MFFYKIKNKLFLTVLKYNCIFFFLQVSEYLKKQMSAIDENPSEEMQNMMKEHDKLVEEIFIHEDKDKNGYISHDEFSGPKHDEL